MGDHSWNGARARLGASRVSVLGPPTIGPLDAPRWVTGKPARLLVALAGADRPITTDQLAEAAWGESLPSTYRSALHVHLGALRRAFAETGAAVGVERTPEGYRLRLDGWERDWALALDLLAAARSRLDDDPAVALEIIEQALPLWRGRAFSVEGEVVEAASAHRLDAARLEAEELLVEALLRTGQAERAETGALAGVGSEPLREHRWGQLLRARYLAGRTADALATYREARATLTAALGIEPGDELRSLEGAVLTQDRERLRLPAAPDEAPPGPPATPGTFVGRGPELERLAALSAAGHPVAILGPPGVGKSRLAGELVRHLRADEVAWIDLRKDDGAAVHQVLDRWVRRHPAGVIVLDGAEDAPDAARQLIADLAQRSPRTPIVVTSRKPIESIAAVEVLRPLDLPEEEGSDAAVEAAPAVRLLRAALSELAPAAQLTSAQAARLAARSGGLPLVLRLQAATARSVPFDALVEQPSSTEGDPIDRATCALVTQLPDAVADAFCDLCTLDSGFDVDLGARVAGMTEAAFVPTVAALADHGLVDAQPERTRPYAIPAPIRAAGNRLLDRTRRRPTVLDRHVQACIDRAHAIQRAATTMTTTTVEAQLTCDLVDHRRALAHLASIGDAERALTLACRLEAALYSLGWWVEKVELLDTALAIPGPPSTMRSRAHAFRARPGPMHHFDLEHAEIAEAMARDLGHEALAAFARHLQSIGLWWWGRHEEAIRCADEAARALDRPGLRREWCEARKFLGVAMVSAGDPDAGLEVQREVLREVRTLGNAFNVGHNLAYLGHCHRMLGDDQAALADWTEARALCRKVGNRGTAIHVELGLAELLLDRGDAVAALSHVGEASTMSSSARNVVYEPWAWTIAARANARQGDRGAAIASAWRAIEALPAAPPGEAVRLAIGLAEIALAGGDAATAARLLGTADATEDRRELPFPPLSEAARRTAATEAVQRALGSSAARHHAAGARCTIVEAAADLLHGDQPG